MMKLHDWGVRLASLDAASWIKSLETMIADIHASVSGAGPARSDVSV